MSEFNQINNIIYWDMAKTAQTYKKEYGIRGYRTINKFIWVFLQEYKDILGIKIIHDMTEDKSYNYPHVQVVLKEDSVFNMYDLMHIVTHPFNLVAPQDISFQNYEEVEEQRLNAKNKVDEYFKQFLFYYRLNKDLPEKTLPLKPVKI